MIRQLCDELPAGAATTEVLGLTDIYLDSHHVVALAEPGTERIRRGDGRRAPVPIDARRWTTPDLLAVEKHLIGMATHRRNAGAASPEPNTSRPPSPPARPSATCSRR